MQDSVEKKRRFIINVVYFALIVVLVYFVFKYILAALAPFVLAFLIASILRPAVRFIKNKMKFKLRIASTAVVILFYCTVGALLTFGTIRLVAAVIKWVNMLPDYYKNTLMPAVKDVLSAVEEKLKIVNPDISLDINTVMSWLAARLQEMTKMVDTVFTLVSGIPSLLLSILITIIATFFISADYEHIGKWCIAQFPEKTQNTILEIKRYVTTILLKYIRSYALILLITFTELFVSLSIANLIFPDMVGSMGRVALVSFLIAVFDILPVVGTGTVLIPWAVVSLIQNKLGIGLALLIVYVVITVIRQIIEPKIVGKQVGLHPVATLIAMVSGTALFGIVGLFGFPIILALLTDLNRREKIHIFKSIPHENTNNND